MYGSNFSAVTIRRYFSAVGGFSIFRFLAVTTLAEAVNISLSPFAPENLVSRDGFGRPVPRQPAHSPHAG